MSYCECDSQAKDGQGGLDVNSEESHVYAGSSRYRLCRVGGDAYISASAFPKDYVCSYPRSQQQRWLLCSELILPSDLRKNLNFFIVPNIEINIKQKSKDN